MPALNMLSASDSLEKRLAYYRHKYGEDFQPTDEMLASMSAPDPAPTIESSETAPSPKRDEKRPGVWARLRRIFGDKE